MLYKYVHVNFPEESAALLSGYMNKWHNEKTTSIQGQGVPQQGPRYAGKIPHSNSDLISPIPP
jgi:hypothetical protein